jgi:hypothetical protein
MKRLIEIIFITLLSAELISAISVHDRIISTRVSDSFSSLKDDTTGLLRLLKIDTFRLDIIPPSSGVQFYKDRIVFLSMSKNEMKMSSNQISFGAVEAYSAYVKDSVLGKHAVFSPLASFSYPCEALSFSRDCNTIYFTKIPKKSNKEKIFKAKFTANIKNQTELVSESDPLEFCSDNANYSHPALSADETMMVFASDRAGSFGGMDLYIARKTGDKWSTPENLGSLINTPGNEFYPFLDLENNLYFSSDKLPGYGGYDIFTSNFNGKGWDKPMNLSDHINSNKDDIAFTINKTDGKTAFFTRRQKSGNADMQLFRIRFTTKNPESNLLTISYIFNGRPVSKPDLTVPPEPETGKITSSQPLMTKPERQTISETGKQKREKQVDAEPIKKTEKQVINEPAKIKPEKEVVTRTEPEIRPAKADIANKAIPLQTDQKDVVVYKVQILPNRSQLNAKKMDISGTSYKIDEYLYLGAIRYTVGEFSSLGQATALQKICRQAGYPQSFVVAFKNNTRSLDKSLFK